MVVAEETEDRASYTEIAIRSRAEMERRLALMADEVKQLEDRVAESDWPPPPSSPVPPYEEPPSTPPPSERH